MIISFIVFTGIHVLYKYRTGDKDLFSYEALCFFSSNFWQFLNFDFLHSPMFIIQINKNNLDYFKDLTDTKYFDSTFLHLNLDIKKRFNLCKITATTLWLCRSSSFHFKISVRSFEFEKTLCCLTINVCIKNNVCSIDTNSCSFYI